jgi:hypothetical protein
MCELVVRRPLFPPGIELSPDEAEVVNTFRCAAADLLPRYDTVLVISGVKWHRDWVIYLRVDNNTAMCVV